MSRQGRQKKHMSEMSIPELLRRMSSYILSTARNGTGATRLATEYQTRIRGKAILPRPPSYFICIDTGLQTTFSGHGALLDQFKKKMPLSNYTGFGQIAKTSSDPKFNDADVREVNYVDTFSMQSYKITKNDCYDPEVDKPVKVVKRKDSEDLPQYLPDLPSVEPESQKEEGKLEKSQDLNNDNDRNCADELSDDGSLGPVAQPVPVVPVMNIDDSSSDVDVQTSDAPSRPLEVRPRKRKRFQDQEQDVVPSRKVRSSGRPSKDKGICVPKSKKPSTAPAAQDISMRSRRQPTCTPLTSGDGKGKQGDSSDVSVDQQDKNVPSGDVSPKDPRSQEIEFPDMTEAHHIFTDHPQASVDLCNVPQCINKSNTCEAEQENDALNDDILNYSFDISLLNLLTVDKELEKVDLDVYTT